MKHPIVKIMPLFLPAALVLVLFGTSSAIGDTKVEKSKVPDPASRVISHPLPADPGPLTRVVEAAAPSPGPIVADPVEAPSPSGPIVADPVEAPLPPGPFIADPVELCYEDGCGSEEDEEESSSDQQQSSGSTTGQSASTQTPSSNSTEGDDNDPEKKKKSNKKRTPSNDSDSDQADSDSQAVAGTAEPIATHGVTVVITSNLKLNDEGELDITKSQLKDLIFGGIKGYVSPSSAVSGLMASLYRKVGDECFLVYPSHKSVDCSSYGNGRLHQLQDDGDLRFAYRALQPSDGGSHSSEVKQLSESGAAGSFLRAGTYVFSVQVTTTGGDTQTASYRLNVS